MLQKTELQPRDGRCFAQSHKSEPGSSTFNPPVLFMKLIGKNLLKASLHEHGVGQRERC